MPDADTPDPRRLLDHPMVSRQVFHPRPSRSAPDLFVETDGWRLGCHVRRVSPDSGWVVCFHGNGELASEGGVFPGPLFAAAGVNVCHAEYRGYGQSTGRPALASMLDDGERIVAALGAPPHRVVAFGRSLGSLYAIELATRLPSLGGLILDSGIAALSELWPLGDRAAAMGCDAAEIDAAISALFDHRAKLAGWRGPLLVLHAAGDRLVPPSHAERLRAWAGGDDASLVVFPHGDHNSIFPANRDRYVAVVGDFLRRTGVTSRRVRSCRRTVKERGMAHLAGFIQLLLALILAIVGMWSAIFVAPWAFFGDRPDYAFVAIVCSPLLLSAILFGSAYLTLSSSPGSTRTRESGTRPGNDSTRLHDAPRSDEHGP